MEENLKNLQSQTEVNVSKQIELLKNELLNEQQKVKLEQQKALAQSLNAKNQISNKESEIVKLTMHKNSLSKQVDQHDQMQEHYNIGEEQMQLQLQVLEKQRKEAVSKLDQFLKIAKDDKQV